MNQAKRIVIVGGVAGGASAAARARRLSEDARIALFERGEHVSFANCGLPYHIGGAIPDRDHLLVQTAEGLRKRYNIDVRTRSEVVRIDRDARKVLVRNLDSGRQYEQPYDVLILSPGAEPVRPSIPGADGGRVFTLRSISDMDAIKGFMDRERPAHAVVVGGGYIGLEMTEAVRNRGLDVTLVEMAAQVLVAADPEMVAPIHRELDLHGVDLRLGTSVTSIRQEVDRLRVQTSDGQSVETDFVILAVGVRPDVRLAREAGLEIGPTGGIAVDRHMRTSDASIYAVGDAVEVTHLVGGEKTLLALAGPASRQARVAADNALGRQSVYRGGQGTAICKVFGLVIGMTGQSEGSLRRMKTPFEKVYVHPASHAAYYPGASQMSIKLLFSPDGGKILGAQVVGADGVDKRTDVLAVAIRAGMTVQDLRELELSYAPPFGSARDPINYAGYVASNVLEGDVAVCHVRDVIDPPPSRMLLDVSTPAEVEAGTIPGARNIPIDQLRERLAELPREKEIVTFCRVGLRGYLASRILSQHGYRCRNLSGGYKTYAAAAGVLPGENSGAAKVMDDAGAAPSAGVGKADDLEVVKEIDARAMQCPGRSCV